MTSPGRVAVLAGGALVVGFAVADLTGVRALGGVVLLLAAVGCGRAWQHLAGTPVAAGLVGLGLVAFVAAHPLAHLLGAWPSVLLVAALAGGLSYALTRRPRPRPA